MEAIAAPDVGQTAPDFKLKGPGGQWVTLSEFRGRKPVVLVFYPLAFSPMCSHQLPLIQKELPRFQALQAEVLGISVDSHYANEAFAKHLRLSFPLLSDFRRLASMAYGVLNADTLCSGRAVFVVDRLGVIAYKDLSPAPGDPSKIPDPERVLSALERLT